MSKKRWTDLSERTRRRIIIGAAFEGILKSAALIDLKRRPASTVKGAKWKWATAIVLVNSLGLVPLAYFVYGCRTAAQR